MDAGLAVVATRVGDVEQMVAEENRPYVVNGSDSELGAAMRALVADAARRKEIGAKNRQRMRQAYSARDMIASYQTLFLKTAGSRD